MRARRGGAGHLTEARSGGRRASESTASPEAPGGGADPPYPPQRQPGRRLLCPERQSPPAHAVDQSPSGDVRA